MYCERCGQPIQETEPVCRNCGAQNMFYKSPEEIQKKRKLITLLFIFIGITILAVSALILWKSLSKGDKDNDGQSSSFEESSSIPPVVENSSQNNSGSKNESPAPSESTDVWTETDETSASDETEASMPEEESSVKDESAKPIQEKVTEESEEIETETEEESQPAQTGYPAISMNNIIGSSESSYLKESDLHYPASSTIDGDPATGWSEDISGYGEGEWIELTFDGTYLLSGMRIAIGLQTDSDRYFNNSRPREILLTFPDGTEILAEVEDRMGYQTISFDTPVASSNLKVTIFSVYRGSKYADTLISEIELY